MFIRNCITYVEDLVILNDDYIVEDAIKILKDNNLKSIPVIDRNGFFLGILSKESLFELFEKGLFKSYNELKNETIIQAITYIKPLNLNNFFEETLSIIVRYPFVPIVDDENHLLGIVKRKDITHTLETSFGINVPGIRLLIGVPEMEGRLEKILKYAHNYHINVITALAFDAGERFNRRVLLKINFTDQKDKFISDLETHGLKVIKMDEDKV